MKNSSAGFDFFVPGDNETKDFISDGVTPGPAFLSFYIEEKKKSLARPALQFFILGEGKNLG